MLWNFEEEEKSPPTLLSKFEGGGEIPPQGEFPPRVPSWPRKRGVGVTLLYLTRQLQRDVAS